MQIYCHKINCIYVYNQNSNRNFVVNVEYDYSYGHKSMLGSSDVHTTFLFNRCCTNERSSSKIQKTAAAAAVAAAAAAAAAAAVAVAVVVATAAAAAASAAASAAVLTVSVKSANIAFQCKIVFSDKETVSICVIALCLKRADFYILH